MTNEGSSGDTPRQCVYRFGDFLLSPGRQLLLYEGQPVALGGRGFDILTLLVTRAGEVVSKADLISHVWPDYIVHEHNLKVNVGNLRRSLARFDLTADYIATIAGRGYKFVATVESANPTAAPGPASGVHPAGMPKATRLFGREEAIEQISRQLQQPGYVTIVGPGGGGKTSLAVTIMQQCRVAGQAIVFVDLSTVSDHRFVVPAIASAFGISLGLDDPIAAVIETMRNQALLLIIDNCEHVLAMAGTIVERISAELPDASIVATSREPLRTRHEQIHFLLGLSYPDHTKPLRARDALSFPAVQLFMAKANASRDVQMTDEYARDVASICARLEGLALAIELAAGTASVLAPSALQQLFRNGFGTMNRGPRDAPLRHQTLEATLDWSYRLLPDREAVVLGLLSVFSGRFAADDAEAMYPAGGLDPMTGRDALAQLVAKSLVSAEVEGGSVLYRLPESTGAYAARRLFGAPHREQARRHYAARVRDKLQTAERDWSSQTSREWLRKYQSQINDVRAVIAWAFDPSGDPDIGVELVVAALPLWQELSAFREMLSAIELAAEAGSAFLNLAPSARAKLSTAQAWAMTLARQIHMRTDGAWLQSIHDAAEAGDAELELRAIFGQAVFLTYSGRPLAALRRMSDFAASSGLDWTVAPDGKRLLAHVEVYAGRLSSAATRLDELMATWGGLQDGRGLSRFQVDLPVAIGLSRSFLLWLQGDVERASHLAARAVDRATDLDHMISLGNAICLAGLPIAYLSGEFAVAARLQQQLAQVGRRESVGIYEGTSLFFGGAIRMAQGEQDGLALMQQGISELHAHGWRTRVAFYRCLLAEAWIKAGDVRRAEDCFRPAVAQADVRQERWCHPELWRVAGVIEAARQRRAQADRYFEKSLRAAKAMGAGSAIRRTEASVAAAD
ncbi:winged helix-turn-helix domain-containing protein [Sphingomonas sp. BIUV-7]|uniref:Winged helix-turn-helix domain-containing protein n=1 Tax=Sphingomonas natans TaxID=3063330 RepID=A0ABT8Y7H8_9SPHN|nr:winged helix-turn-helix domain-containing protein [Sphingomonas sp. BIUV-7]